VNGLGLDTRSRTQQRVRRPQRAAATRQRGPQHGSARLWRVLDRRRRMR